MKERSLFSSPYCVWWIATLLIIVFALQAATSMWQKSVTVDEITYIAAGYYHLRSGDFHMNMTNPPFMKMAAALPLLFVSLELPPLVSDPGGWNAIQEWQYAREFLYGNVVDADRMLFLARLPIVIIAIGLGFFLFIWSKSLYGTGAGLFALFLYSFSPNILAHSRLATQDLGLTAFMFIATYFFWRTVDDGRFRFLILCGLFFGVAVITKSIGLLLLPIFGLYGIARILRTNSEYALADHLFTRFVPERNVRRLASLVISLLVIGFIGLLVVNTGYAFQGSLRPIDSELYGAVADRLAPMEGIQSQILGAFRTLPIPLPSAYVQSLVFQIGLATGSGNVYFNGDIYPAGLWYLMPVSFLLKSPLPVIILLAASVIFLFVPNGKLDAEWLFIYFIIVVVGVFVLVSNTNVGVRYILPIYPIVFLLISRLFTVQSLHRRWPEGVLILLSAWYLVGTLMIYPHYLAYFNESIGGPKNGYKYLADSNVDWGQDLKGLKWYMEQRGIEKIKLAYFGSADADYYEIDYDYMPSVGLKPKQPGQYWWYEINSEEKTYLQPQTGTLAVSANMLASPGWLHPLFHDSYTWLREHEPVDQVGYSILIYEID